MAKRTINHIKLGIFVIAGLAFLILMLYVIGKNQNLFGKTFKLKAHFENVRGLMLGNNIRFAGIDAGTVKDIEVLNDTTIEVTLMVKTNLKKYIHKNARVSITTDGLMGNKIINIEPSKEPAPEVEEGDILFSSYSPDTDLMLKVLNNTNNDLGSIARELKLTISRVNESKAIWSVLNDETLPANIRASFIHVKNASENLNDMMVHLNGMIRDVNQGKGSLGKILRDTAIALDITDAIGKLKNVGNSADTLAHRIDLLIIDISNEINNGNGIANGVLKDTAWRQNINHSLINIELGTKAFNENMLAMRQHFLFREYFRKQEKAEKKNANKK